MIKKQNLLSLKAELQKIKESVQVFSDQLDLLIENEKGSSSEINLNPELFFNESDFFSLDQERKDLIMLQDLKIRLICAPKIKDEYGLVSIPSVERIKVYNETGCESAFNGLKRRVNLNN